MALTATFEANFSSFYSAVDGATARLRDFAGVSEETGAELSQMVDAQVPQEMQQLADATNDVSAANQGASLSVTDLITAYVSAEAILAAATAAWSALVDVVGQSITSAAEAEEAQVGLVTALTAQGTAVPSVIQAYSDYATALQQTTRYSDDAVTAAERILVQIGNVMPRDMEKALQATTNLATGLKKDLPEAAMLVAKAADGQTDALKRYGVTVDETGGKGASFAGVLDTINAQFAGAAQADAQTYAGQIDQLGNTWDNLLESVGRTITQNETVKTLLGEVNRLIGTQTGELNQNAKANNLVSDAVILVAQAMSGAVEALDLLQQGFTWTQQRLLNLTKSFYEFGIGIQQIEIFTQKWLALDRTMAATRIAEAEAAIGRYRTGIDQAEKGMAAAQARSESWTTTLKGVQGTIDSLVTKLEATRGKTVEVTAAQTEANAVWQKGTGDIAAATMATQEHTQALELLEKSMWKIDTAATAVARSREAAIVASTAAEVKARADAEAAFWQMHDAEEAAMLQTAATASETVAAVGRIAETVVVQGNNISQAMSGWIGGWGGVGQLPTPTPGYNPATDAYAPWLQSTRMPNYLSGLAPPGSMYRDPRLSGFGGGETHVTVNAMYPIMDDPQAMNQLARVVGEAVMGRVTGTGTRV